MIDINSSIKLDKLRNLHTHLLTTKRQLDETIKIIDKDLVRLNDRYYWDLNPIISEKLKNSSMYLDELIKVNKDNIKTEIIECLTKQIISIEEGKTKFTENMDIECKKDEVHNYL